MARGRLPNESDGKDAPLVAVINETMARKFWPNQDVVGKRFKDSSPEEKAWIEARFRWLQSEFGADRVMVPVLKPTLKIFPRVWNGTIHECRQLTTDLCEYMEVERDRVDLSFFQKTQNPLARRLPSFESSEQGAAGVYHGVTVGGRFRISIASEQLGSPSVIVVGDEIADGVAGSDNLKAHRLAEWLRRQPRGAATAHDACRHSPAAVRGGLGPLRSQQPLGQRLHETFRPDAFEKGDDD